MFPASQLSLFRFVSESASQERRPRQIGWKIFNDDCISADRNVIANCNRSDHNGTTTDCNIIPNNRWSCCVFISDIYQLIDPAVFPDGFRSNVGAEAVLNIQSAADVQGSDVQRIQRG